MYSFQNDTVAIFVGLFSSVRLAFQCIEKDVLLTRSTLEALCLDPLERPLDWRKDEVFVTLG